MNLGAIIPAAGSGQRMGGTRKAFLEIRGKPMLQYSLDVLLQHPAVRAIVVALPDDVAAAPPAWLQHPAVTVVAGGSERADSVRCALRAFGPEIDAVLVHDAARPLLTTAMIERVLTEVRAGRSATLALPSTDTLHEVDESGRIVGTPGRARFHRAQTPQAFPRSILEEAFARQRDGSRATDEAGMVAAGGWQVVVVPGEAANIKVTNPGDVALVENILRDRTT